MRLEKVHDFNYQIIIFRKSTVEIIIAWHANSSLCLANFASNLREMNFPNFLRIETNRMRDKPNRDEPNRTETGARRTGTNRDRIPAGLA